MKVKYSVKKTIVYQGQLCYIDGEEFGRVTLRPLNGGYITSYSIPKEELRKYLE